MHLCLRLLHLKAFFSDDDGCGRLLEEEEGPSAEKTGRGSLLNRPSCLPDEPIVQGTELNCTCLINGCVATVHKDAVSVVVFFAESFSLVGTLRTN